MNQRVLVTGGTGFAGSHLIEALLEVGYQDIHTTCFGQPTEFISKLLPASSVHQLDLTNADAVNTLIKDLQPDQIYHLAAFAFVGESFNRAQELMQNNVALQLNLLEAMRQFLPQGRLMVVGSAEEYGLNQEIDGKVNEDAPFHPVNPYAVSKVTQDLLAYSYFVSYHLNIVRVRPFNHIGERQSSAFAIPAFVTQIVDIERGKKTTLNVGNTQAIRDFTDVKDMVQAYLLVMEKGESGQVYNIGSGIGVSIQEVLDQLISLSSVKIQVVSDEKRLRPLDIPKMIADNSKIVSLGWTPKIPLSKTLDRIIEWYRRVPDVN